MSFRLTDRADRELATIYVESVDRFGISQADSYVDGLRDTLTFLAANPRIAREREELNSRARAHRYKSHMIVYREDGDGILIIRLPHARSDWTSVLD